MVRDESGFIFGKLLAISINKTYLPLEDEVSTPDDIDLAMKLYTGYPDGPLKRASIIGSRNNYQLLQKLSLQNKLSLPASLLNSAAYS